MGKLEEIEAKFETEPPDADWMEDVGWLIQSLNRQRINEAKFPIEARQEIFNHWSRLFGREKCAFRQGDIRDIKIINRLREFSMEVLKEALDGYASDPWRHGGASRNELRAIFRDVTAVEAGLEMANGSGLHPGAQPTDQEVHSRANATVGFAGEDRSRPSGLHSGGRNTLHDGAGGRITVPRDGPDREEDLPF